MFQVTYQFKNLTTAGFSCALLGRTFSCQQIAALLLLSAGVALVQLDKQRSGSTGGGEHHSAGAPAEVQLLGLAGVLGACCTSGFAGVYFEKVLKR